MIFYLVIFKLNFVNIYAYIEVYTYVHLGLYFLWEIDFIYFSMLTHIHHRFFYLYTHAWLFFFPRFSGTIIDWVWFFYFVLVNCLFFNIYAHIVIYIYGHSRFCFKKRFWFIYFYIYKMNGHLNPFNLIVAIQRWIGHGCTMQTGRTTIPMHEMRGHSWYIAHAKPTRI